MLQYIDLTPNITKDSNTILTGRSALSIRDVWCSRDPRVIMITSNTISETKYIDPIYIICTKDEPIEIEIINGVRMTTINWNLYHFFKYDYDDSAIFEFLECEYQDIIIETFKSWLMKNNYQDVLIKVLDYEQYFEKEILNGKCF